MNIRAVFRAGITFFREVIPGGTIAPGTPPRDRIDRILTATAREFAATLVTRDRAMLAYGEKGNVSVLAC
jgi:hypothetical protein